MNDRRVTTFAKLITATAFAQTQTKKPKSKKARAPKLRKVGTSALNKQKKLKRVNETFLKLEQDYRNLLAANAQLKEEIDRLNKLLDACVTNETQLTEVYNAGLSEFAWWKDGVQYVGTCGKLLKDYLKKSKEHGCSNS